MKVGYDLLNKRKEKCGKRCYSIFDEISYLNGSYDVIALVSDERHIHRFEGNDENTLIVACDWLLWEKCLNKKMHCVHLERGFRSWPEDNKWESELFIRANDWVYLDGKDATVFKGVSLGKQFNKQMQIVLWNTVKLEFCLNTLVEEFKPAKLLFIDVNVEGPCLLDYSAKYLIVSAVAEKYGIEFVDLCQKSNKYDQNVLSSHYSFKIENVNFKKTIKRIYLWAIDLLSYILYLIRPSKNCIMICPSGPLLGGLVKSFERKKISPIILGNNIQKQPDFIFECLRKGFLIVNLNRCSLTEKEHEKVQDIIATLERSWNHSQKLREEVLRHFVKKEVFETGWFLEMAIEIKRNKKLFQRFSIERVLVAGVGNPSERIKMEIAHEKGIPIDYILHGMRLRRMKYDAICGDEYSRPIVSRVLSWGKRNEDWLDGIEAKLVHVRCGNPGYDQLRGKFVGSKSDTICGNVLILQYPIGLEDPKSLGCKSYEYYVRVARLLRDMGYSNIRFRPHHAVCDVAYYEEISRYFGVQCSIERDRPFIDLIASSDIIIGPVDSGAFLEVVATGKNYFAVSLEPTATIKKYLEGVKIISDVSELRNAIENSEFQNSELILKQFCSFDEIQNSSERLWNTIETEIS